MAQFQEMMAANQRPGVPVQAVDQPQPTATSAAAAELPPPGNRAPATTSTMAAPAPITVNLVMPDGGTAPHRGARGGRGRGWGRVWRGQGRTGSPIQGHGGASQQLSTNLNAAAQPFPASNGAATTGHHTTATAPCANCGRAYLPDQCNAENEPCYECHAVGHYARCCPYRLYPPNSYKGYGPTAVRGVWKIAGNPGGLHAFVSGTIHNRNARLLCDTVRSVIVCRLSTTIDI